MRIWNTSNLDSRGFIENFLNFLGVSMTLFAVAHLYMMISHNKIIKPTVRCRYCKKYISVEVRLIALDFKPSN